jgi:ribonuclease HI
MRWSKVTTVFADASWCPNTKAGGWGCWIKNEFSTNTYSGAFKAPLPCSAAAEFSAAANALHIGIKKGHVARNGLVVMQTDCEKVLMAMSRDYRREWSAKHRQRCGFPGLNTAEMTALRALHSLASTANVELRWKHVRGHQGGGNARSWVNERCDSLAKAAMREARERAKPAGDIAKCNP